VARRVRTEWRFGRGWTEAELRDRLAALVSREPSAPAKFDAMRREDGWREVRSDALVARETPGPPVPGGAFERAWKGLGTYAFSDPRVVTVHYDPASPFVGRRLLLELRVLGLRYLCGVVIRDERREVTATETVRGFRYDTLHGHLERGGEWFLLCKSRETGEVHFRIHARWQPGDFPNAWSRAGFVVLGRRYQRLWHRRAHHRLSVIAAAPEEVRGKAPEALPEGVRRPVEPPLADPPAEAAIADRPTPPAIGDVQPRRRGYRGRLAHPGVEVRFSSWAGADERYRLPPAVTAALLGAVTGLRSFSGLATVASARGDAGAAAGESRLEKILADPTLSGLLEWAARAEMVADKVPGMPARSEPLPLAGRVAFGGLAGLLVARRRKSGWVLPALLGAAAAGAVAVGASRARVALGRRGFADLPLGLAEDACVLAARRLLRPSAR
jgi:uncharacterized protein (UPF0548 family)/uncharacterized membrane protein